MRGQSSVPIPPDAETAGGLALRLVQAESALQAHSAGQIDSVLDAEGKTYLLRSAQEQLRENERWLHGVVEGAADAIAVVNRAGTICSHSQAVRGVLGYDPQELVGTSIFDCVHHDDWPGFFFAFFNVIEAFQETATAHFRHRLRDGTWRAVESTVGKVRDFPSPNVVLSMRAATAVRYESPGLDRLAASEAQAALVKDRFLAMLSHELRTPLTPALLAIGQLQGDDRFAEARPLLAIVRRNLEVQSRMLDEFGDFTALGQQKLRLRLERLDVHEIVGFVLQTCAGEIAQGQINVVFDFRASQPTVEADPVRLQQVMWNLLRNALKFSVAGGLVTISSANRADGSVMVTFVDGGIGIEPELLPLVFDAFQQGDRWLQELHGGLGLGLFIAKGLTHALHGSLTVASEGRGRGTTFQLTLPAACPAE